MGEKEKPAMRAMLLGIFLSAVLFVPALAAEPPLPPAAPIPDVKSIAGRWKVAATDRSTGQTASFLWDIKEDGSFEMIPMGFTGVLRVVDGRVLYRNVTTGRTGVLSLHEGGGRRLLRGGPDDGAFSFELTPSVPRLALPALKDLNPALSATDSGAIWFASAGSLVRTPDGSRFVLGGPVVISGDLSFPSGTGPFPVVVLAHGCRGTGGAETGWAPALREWGYATFVIDSFRGRNLTEVCTSAGTLTGTQRIPDAYGALRILATHPKIDARRVALMGFSHGGILTMGASTAWAKETFAPPGHPAFRVFLPFYPYCNTVYPERERISAPVRIHTGELDDWTPARPCVRLAETLKASGQDVTITIYPGSHHSFDNIWGAFLRLPNVDSGADCAFQIASILGPFPSASDTARCSRKGATIAPNPDATEQARRNVRAQLAELLK